MDAVKIKAKSSYMHKGRLFVDCAECNRGGNGEDVDECSCGWQIKRINKGGCFCGELMDKYEAKELLK